ncbi:MAG TPA: hypothetical protein VL126_01030 [Bacteroidota bacterium]|nr:hypothetical protein [Bacteroidota bacterium]
MQNILGLAKVPLQNEQANPVRESSRLHSAGIVFRDEDGNPV